MWDKILELAIGDGLWALLFCVLLIYEVKDSRMREGKYQDTISSLAKDLEYIKNIDEEIKEIDADIEQMNNAVKECVEKVSEVGNCPNKKIKRDSEEERASKTAARTYEEVRKENA